jgi:mannan endo-1,4-beta-mannosidase
MKLYKAAVLSFASLVLAIPFSQPVAGDVQASEPIEKRDTNAEVLGLRFDWDGDGRKLYLPGTNAYWTGFLTENSDVDLVFSHLNSSYLNVLRVWGKFIYSPTSYRYSTKYYRI